MIAHKCPEYRVIVVDIDAERIRAGSLIACRSTRPGLAELVRGSLNRNLFFSTDIVAGIEQADIIFVSVNTPTKTFGQAPARRGTCSTGRRPRGRSWAHSTSDKIVVEKSTLPVRTG